MPKKPVPTILDQVASHRLPSELFAAMTPVLIAGAKSVAEASKDKKDEAREANRRALNAGQRYGMVSLESINRYFGVIDRIETASRLLLLYPTSISKGKKGMTRDTWIDYHFGYLTVALASLADTSLLLTNVVYSMGLAPRHCTKDVILSHEKIPPSVKSSLKQYHKTLKAHIERRNRLVHRGESADVGELTDPEFISSLRMLGLVKKYHSDDELDTYFPMFWRQALGDIKVELTTIKAAVASETLALFEALYGKWHSRFDTLIKLGTAFE